MEHPFGKGLAMRKTLVISCLLSAEVAAARPMTLDEAQSEAERLAKSVVVAERQADVARADVKVAGALQNPNLLLQSSRLSGWLNAGITVPLPLFGQRGKMIEAAQADAQVSALEVVIAQTEARFAAASAWVDLWEAQRRVELLQRAAASAGRFLDIARTRFEAGSAPRLDVLRAGAERSRAEAEATAAQSLIAAAAARLLPWTAAADDATSADAKLQAAGEPPAVERVAPALPGLSDLQSAARSHPLLHRDRAEAAAAIAHVHSEMRQRWPVISAQFAVNFGDTAFSGTDFIGGLAFDLPILNLRGGAIARARAQGTVADATLELDERRTLAAVGDAYHSLQAAASRARALRTQVLPAMDEAAKMTEDSYRQGRADLVRLLEAQRAVVETGLSEVEAVSAFAKALALLERSVGRKLDAR